MLVYRDSPRAGWLETSAEQYQQFVAGNSNDVLARIERLLAEMARVNEQYSDEQVEADLAVATRQVRQHKRA